MFGKPRSVLDLPPDASPEEVKEAARRELADAEVALERLRQEVDVKGRRPWS